MVKSGAMETTLSQHVDSDNRRVVVERIEHGVKRVKFVSDVKVMLGEAPSLDEVETDLRLQHRVAYLQPSIARAS